MDKTKVLVALGLGALAVGGVLFYTKSQKDKSEADANLRMAQDKWKAQAEADAVLVAQQVAALPPPPPAYVQPKRRLEVRNGRGMGEFKWFGIQSSSRNLAQTLDIGDQGMVNDIIPCSVSDFWIDANGKKGAFRCEGMEYYDIPNGSRFEW